SMVRQRDGIDSERLARLATDLAAGRAPTGSDRRATEWREVLAMMRATEAAKALRAEVAELERKRRRALYVDLEGSAVRTPVSVRAADFRRLWSQIDDVGPLILFVVSLPVGPSDLAPLREM